MVIDSVKCLGARWLIVSNIAKKIQGQYETDLFIMRSNAADMLLKREYSYGTGQD